MYTFPFVKLKTDLTGEKLQELIINSSMGHKFPVMFFDDKDVFMYGKNKKGAWGITQLSAEVSKIVNFSIKPNHGYLEPKNKVPLEVFMDIFFRKAHLLLPGGVKFFRYPFAIGGDRAPVPDPTQLDGTVSYQEGYGPDYQLDLQTDPDALAILRNQYNQVLYDVTLAIQQYQTNGFCDFIPSSENGGSPYPYDIYAVVRYDDGGGTKLYESKVTNNTSLPTDTTKWRVLTSAVAAQVTKTNNQSITTGAPRLIQFNLAEYDDNSLFNASTHAFDLTAPGYYEFTSEVSVDSPVGVPTGLYLRIYKNASVLFKQLDAITIPAGSEDSVGGTVQAKVTVPTSFDVRLETNNNVNIGGTGLEYRNYFSVTYLGPL